MNINSMYLAINGNGKVPLIPFWILFIGIAIYAFKDLSLTTQNDHLIN